MARNVGCTFGAGVNFWEYETGVGTCCISCSLNGDEVFVPGQRGDESPNLFPEVRIRRSGGLIRKTELLFTQTQKAGPSWSIFIGLGFLIASLMYHRMILGIPDLDNFSGKD